MDVTIKTRDSIETVAAQILTANSSVFSNLINKLGFKEIEIEDFHPDTVRIFLTLIEEIELDDIERQHFRELHKLSVVFEVKWLIRRCRNWLGDQIENLDTDSTFTDFHYMFHESLFIQLKWKIEDFTDLFIEKRERYNFSSFVLKKLTNPNYEAKKKEELDIILKLCAGRTQDLLRTLIHRISITHDHTLSDNTKYLLENINLALCFEQSRGLYHKLFDAISLIPNLMCVDYKMLFKLSTESTKKLFSRQKFVPNTTLHDMRALELREDTYETLDDALQIVRSGVVLNMFGVLDLLVKVTALHPPEFEEAKNFVDSLVEHFKELPSRRASKRYVDRMVVAMTSSNHPQKCRGVTLLQMIRDSENLVVKHEHVCFKFDFPEVLDMMASPVGKIIQYCLEWTPLPRIVRSAASERVFLLRFNSPGFFDCKEPGKCGIAIKTCFTNSLNPMKDQNFKLEFSTKDEDYKGYGCHLHEFLSAEKMHFYFEVTAPTCDGNQFKVANQVMGRWSKWWFTDNSHKSFSSDKFTDIRVECYVKDHLVAL